MTYHTTRKWWALALATLVLVSASCKSDSEKDTSSKFLPVAKVTPSCIKPGKEATIKISGAPNANVVIVPVYSIGTAIDSTQPPRGDTNAKGDLTTKWTIPEGAPPGTGMAKVALIAGPDTKQLDAPFNVADASGACTTTSTTAPSSGGSNTTAPSTASTKPGETTTTVRGSTTTTPGATTTSTTEPPIANGGEFKTTVTVSKACVEPGKTQTVTVQTIERGFVTYGVGYSNFTGGGNSNQGAADAKGKYEDTFVVPEQNSGRATLQVVVSTSDKKQSFAGVHFDVGNC